MIISSSVLLRMRNVSDKSCRENQNDVFMSNNSYPPPFTPNRTVYEITWKNTPEPDRPKMAIWRTRIACWITKASTLQQWWRELASILHVHCFIPNPFSDGQPISYTAVTRLVVRPASWSSGQGLLLLIMRSRVRFPVLPWEFFLAGKDSRGDHGLGS